MRPAARLSWLVLAAALVGSFAQAQRIGPDGAVGTPDERLAASIEFDATGAFERGEGLAAHVRITWQRRSGFIVRRSLGSTEDGWTAAAAREAARAGFTNYTITGARADAPDDASRLPAAFEYDIRQSMTAGIGGRPWTFDVPAPRPFRRIPATPAGAAPPAHEPRDDAGLIAAAVAPPGRLAVGEVGRWTVRASYALADGMFAAAPDDHHIATDFATFDSHYAVEGRRLRLERRVVLRQLTIDIARKAELEAFASAVEADLAQGFRITPYPPGAPSAADRLNELALDDIDGRRFGEALPALHRATDLDPRHRWAWYNLAVTELYLHEPRSAVGAGTRALEVDPSNPYARIALGQALDLDGRAAEAERTLARQVDLTPRSAWALSSLARFYAQHNRLEKSIDWWRRTLDVAPRDEGATLALGRLYLRLGKVDDALHVFQGHLTPESDPVAFNAAALALADTDAGRPLAASLIGQGLDALVAREAGRSPAHETLDPRDASRYMPAMWDTAGWIAYKQGKYPHAAAWFRAAAALSRDSEIAQHLQQAVVATSGPNFKPVSPVDAGLEGEVATFHDGQVPDWKGAIVIRHDRLGQVLEVRPGAGASMPDRLDADLRTQSVPFVRPPDERDYVVERAGTVECVHGHCTVSLPVPGR